MLSNIRISVRLAILTGLFIIFVAAMGALAMTGLSDMRGRSQTVYDDRVIPLGQLSSIRDRYYSIRLAMIDVTESNDVAIVEERTPELLRYRQEISGLWTSYLATYLTPREKELAEWAVERFDAYDDLRSRILEVARTGDFPRARTLALGGGAKAFNSVTEILADLTRLQIDVAKQEYDVIDYRFARDLNIAFVGLVVSSLLGAGVAFVISNSITAPLRQTMLVMQEMATGNLDVDVPGRERKDELGAVARAINFFKMGLAEVNRMRAEQIHLKERAETDRKVAKMHSEFTSVVSHELRTPLTAMKASIDMIRMAATNEMPANLKKLLDIAAGNTQRFVRLVNDIIDIQNIETGAMEFDAKPLDLGDLLAEGLEATANYAQSRGVHLKIKSEPIKAPIVGDHDRLMQALVNLLSNAIKFSPEASGVEVSLKQINARLRVEITDHGVGIPIDFQNKVFGKFAQADSSDIRQAGGTGLGLALTKAIVEGHGGNIGFESEVGAGTTFYLELTRASGAT